MAEQVNLTADDFKLLPADRHVDNEKIMKPSLSFAKDAWRRLKKNKGAFISLWILVFIFVAAFGSAPFQGSLVMQSWMVSRLIHTIQLAFQRRRISGLELTNLVVTSSSVSFTERVSHCKLR